MGPNTFNKLEDNFQLVCFIGFSYQDINMRLSSYNFNLRKLLLCAVQLFEFKIPSESNKAI